MPIYRSEWNLHVVLHCQCMNRSKRNVDVTDDLLEMTWLNCSVCLFDLSHIYMIYDLVNLISQFLKNISEMTWL